MKLNKNFLLKAVAPVLLLSSVHAESIKLDSMKGSLVSSTIDTTNVTNNEELANQGLGVEFKFKTDSTANIYLGINRFSDRNSLNLRVGLEEKYTKVENFTPFVSASVGGVVSKWSKSPMKNPEFTDSTSSGMIVNFESGAYFQDNLFASASISLTNLTTNIDYLGQEGTLKENKLFSFSIGYLF